MLQRVAEALRACRSTERGRQAIDALLGEFSTGKELLALDGRLKGCSLRKEGGRLFSVA
ncbi:MAG: hypothetical protein JRH10_20220 [Deltaproteobacteria bacterium]|nr:hypothetical protein [Deltaproteobacteria bacterium]MBW2447409.1 hypothetical protein [Deltaproteobacteria bacterium]